MAAIKNPVTAKSTKDLPPNKTVQGGTGKTVLEGHQCLVFFVGGR